MKIMFDENVPWELRKTLREDGHEVVRVQSFPGWKGTKDDALLVAKAKHEGCDAFITADRTNERKEGVADQAKKAWDGRDGRSLDISVITLGDGTADGGDIKKLRGWMPELKLLLSRLDHELRQEREAHQERIEQLNKQGIRLKL